MFPENENDQDTTSGSEPTAVVVDLTETDPAKQAKPLTDDKSGDQGGEEIQDEGESRSADTQDDGEQPVRGRRDFEKRLKREMRAKIQERAGRAAAEEENERLRRENEELRTRGPSREDTANVSELDTKISAKRAELEKALEDGESKTAAALQVEIGELTGQKQARLAAPRRREETTERQDSRRPAAKNGGMSTTGRAFVDANGSWWKDPKHVAVRSAVIAIDNQLLAEGSDPNSDSHYQRIAKRAKELGLKVKIRQPYDDEDSMDNDTEVELDEPNGRRRQAPPMGGNGSIRQRNSSELRDARNNRVVLKLGQPGVFDGPDSDAMRKFKLDPANPAHVRAYAKSRQERVLQEGQS